MSVFGCFDGPEAQPGLALRVRPGHAALNIVFRCQLKVGTDLSVQFAVELLAAEKAQEPMPGAHDLSPVEAANTRDMTLDRRSQ